MNRLWRQFLQDRIGGVLVVMHSGDVCLALLASFLYSIN